MNEVNAVAAHFVNSSVNEVNVFVAYSVNSSVDSDDAVLRQKETLTAEPHFLIVSL